MRYRQYLLVLLMLIMASNYVDRLALGLLLQDIKHDLALSDTQLGLLTGIAFAFFYSIMGIPIARWADRGNRITIITVTTALWTVAVALCGVATSFMQLLLIRVGAAVGEAGCVPPAHSLIADYFSRAERPKAVSIYKLGIPLSVVIGYFGAGWLNLLYGWRMTFVMLGLPGAVLAVLAAVTLKEPRRADAGQSHAGTPGAKEVSITLWRNTTFRNLLLAYSVVSLFGSGLSQWTAAFFIRSYGMQTGDLGTWLTVVYGVGGLIGTYLGGTLASRHAPGDERLQLKIMAMLYCAYGLIAPIVYLTSTRELAFASLLLATLGYYVTLAPLFAAIQSLVPERMRALSIALVLLFANLIGTGLGPLAVGAMSDLFRPWAHEASLRFALLALCPGYFWGAWHLLAASRTVIRDLARV